MANISAIILTYNEEIHIRRCIENLKQITDKIFVIDSYSTDNTVQIAEEQGAKVLYNKWENNYSKQFNWALDNAPIDTNWIIRIDADEYLTEKLIYEINNKLPNISQNVSGIEISLERYFLGKKIKFGIGKISQVRIFRNGKAICEPKMMDEHMMIDGDIISFKGKWVDNNLSTLQEWCSKHNKYAIREAIDYMNIYNISNEEIDKYNLSNKSLTKHKNKNRYSKIPLFWRAFFYFCYRYILILGFLDGKEVFLWHFLQGWWCRTLVDAKIFEIKKRCGNDREKIKNYIKDNYNIEL